MMARGDFCGIALTIVLLCASGNAAGAPSSVEARLFYARGAGAQSCPDEGGLRQAVAARVGFDPFVPEAPISISVELAQESARLRARITIAEKGIEKGSQLLEQAVAPGDVGAHCEELLAAVALTVTIALDANDKNAREAPSSAISAQPPFVPGPVVSSEAQPPSLATPAPLHDRKPEAAPPIVLSPSNRDRKFSLWVAPGARASFGAWPALGAAANLFVELRSGRFGLGLEGRYDLPVTVSLGPGEMASVSHTTGSVLSCAHFGWLSPCAIATFGETRAHGEVPGGTIATAFYGAFGARIGGEVPIASRLHLLASADVVGVATPTHVAIGPNVVTTGPIEASAGVAMLVSIF